VFEAEPRGRLRLRVRVEQVGLDHPEADTDAGLAVLRRGDEDLGPVQEKADLGGEGGRSLRVTGGVESEREEGAREGDEDLPVHVALGFIHSGIAVDEGKIL